MLSLFLSIIDDALSPLHTCDVGSIPRMDHKKGTGSDFPKGKEVPIPISHINPLLKWTVMISGNYGVTE